MANSRSRGPRKNKVWISSGIATRQAVTTTQVAVGAIGVSLLENAQQATILRIRGHIYLRGTPDAATDFASVGLGLIVVQQAAGTAGGVSVPGPVNDAGADWMWRTVRFLDAAGLTGESPTGWGSSIFQIPIDSKAMRKMRADQTLILVAELGSSTMALVEVSAEFRTLLGF